MAKSSPPPPSASLTATPTLGAAIVAVALSSDGTVTFADASGQVFRWDGTDEGEPLKIGDLGETAVAVDADGQSVAAASATIMKMWGPHDELELEFSRPISEYTHVAMWADGNVTTVGWDGLVSVHYPSWRDVWETARQFAQDQGWKPLADADCREVVHAPCPTWRSTGGRSP
jgi:hypothetical protein